MFVIYSRPPYHIFSGARNYLIDLITYIHNTLWYHTVRKKPKEKQPSNSGSSLLIIKGWDNEADGIMGTRLDLGISTDKKQHAYGGSKT